MRYRQIRAEMLDCSDETEFLRCRAWMLGLIDGLSAICSPNSGHTRDKDIVDITRNLVAHPDTSADIDSLSRLLESTGLQAAEERTRIAFRGQSGVLDTARQGMQAGQFLSRHMESLSSQAVSLGRPPDENPDAEQLVEYLSKCTFIATNYGLQGLCLEGRGDVQRGDLVVMLEGIGFPMIMRPEKPDGTKAEDLDCLQGRLIGPAVVRGIMNEEARQYIDDGSFVTQEVHIY